MDKGADLILAAGGDGTINEVANGMVGSSTARHLPGRHSKRAGGRVGYRKQYDRSAAKALSHLAAVRIGVGLLENGNEQRHFVLMAGAGLDALIVYNIDAKLKASLGKVAYWVGGFSQLGRSLPEFEVRRRAGAPFAAVLRLPAG